MSSKEELSIIIQLLILLLPQRLHHIDHTIMKTTSSREIRKYTLKGQKRAKR